MGFMNQLKTIFLLTLMSIFFLWIGKLIGGTTGIIVAVAFSLLFDFGSWWYSDKIILHMYRAEEMPKDSEVYKIVERLARKYGLPMPKVMLVRLGVPNAFAVGRDPKHSAVCVSQELINLLNKDELEGVLGHELTHIKHRDTLISVIASVIASAISYFAYFARFAAIFGGSRDEDNGLELLFLAILAPIIATIIQLSISRAREFLADEGSARLTRKPMALASALRKLEGYKTTKNISSMTENLFIVNPLKNIWKLFSTHPPTEERIKQLEKLQKELNY